MASESNKTSHEERTAAEPRHQNLHPVILSEIESVNETIKLIKLKPKNLKESVKFVPGQWLDVFIPGLPKAGGFTITSTPKQAVGGSSTVPYDHYFHGIDSLQEEGPLLRLAIQRSRNPPAKWLWQPEPTILGTELLVRVGGSFTWPPPGMADARIEKVVFIAGGVGINPFISMLWSMCDASAEWAPQEVQFLYATKQFGQGVKNTLFLEDLVRIQELNGPTRRVPALNLKLFLTGEHSTITGAHGEIHRRRMSDEDVIAALGDGPESRSTVCYVCGPQAMTDYFVELARKQPGIGPDRVFCEKWW